MIVKVSVPSRFQWKTRQTFRTMLMKKEGEIHYIGGADILPAPLDSETEQEMIEKLVGPEEKEARAKLIEHNLRLVVYIAKKFDNTAVGVEDLISIGTIGLIKAISSFDAGKGKLSTYASRCIDNELLMLLRAKKKTRGEVSLFEPIGTDKEGNEINLLDIMEHEQEDITEQMELYENTRKLARLLGEVLNDREREIILLRYGLITGREVTQREIGEALNISRSYVSRIEKKALLKLKEGFSN